LGRSNRRTNQQYRQARKGAREGISHLHSSQVFIEFFRVPTFQSFAALRIRSAELAVKTRGSLPSCQAHLAESPVPAGLPSDCIYSLLSDGTQNVSSKSCLTIQ
jgi:hypothetical protein